MAIIKCGEISLVLILPIITALLQFSNFELYKKTEYENHPIMDCLFSNLLLCLLFIPFLLSKLFYNSKHGSKGHKSKFILKIEKPILFTVIVGALLELVNLLHSIFSNKIASQQDFFMNDYVFELIFIIIASKIFTKSLVFKHQQLSMIFVLILGVLFYVIDYSHYDYKNYIIFFSILKQIIFGISIILIKHITEMKHYSIFKMLMIFGIVGFIMDLFILMITTNVKCKNSLDDICSSIDNNTKVVTQNNNQFSINNIIEDYYIKNFDSNAINITEDIDYYLDNFKIFFDDLKDNPEHEGRKYDIINVVYRIFALISIILIIFVVDKLHPSYTYIVNVLLTIFSKIKELFNDDNDKNDRLIIVLQILIILILLFWSLVYNEIIELNFCGLNEDTHKSRELRDDTDEKRTEDWAKKKGTGDADATLLDDNFNPDSSHSNENFGSMGMGESYVN